MSKPLPREDLEHVLDHTRDLWEEVRGERIFVTGGTGFFGCWLLETFAHANDRLNLGAHLLCLTRSPEGFKKKAPYLAAHPAIGLCKGDVRDFVFPSGGFSHVIHAGTAPGAPIPPGEMLDTITTGTRHTLEFAVTSHARKFLLVSSGAIYGRQPADMMHIPESYTGAPDLMSPDSAYGEGKRAAELLCAIYSKECGLPVKITRCFAFLGPHLALDAHFAAGNFIRDALAGGPIRVKGDGTPYRSFLYAADLAIWLWTILFKGETCRPYNVGSEEAVTIADLARTIADVRNPKLDVIIEKAADPGAPASRYVCACDQARELSLRSHIPLRQQIQRTIAWHQAASPDTGK